MADHLKRAHLSIKVIPSSSRDCLGGWLGEVLKIKVQAPPEKGKANRSVIKNLAKWLGIPAKSITLVSGGAATNKVFVITGMTEDEIHRAVDEASA